MEKQSLRDPRNRNLRNIAFVTIVVILGLILLQSLFGNGTNGQVAQVAIKDGVASAVLVDGSKLTARLPDDASAYQPLFDEAADEYGMDVDYDPPSNSGMFTSIFLSMIPILLLIAVWIYIMRKTQTGGGALSFGQSKAKLVQPNSTARKSSTI